MRRCRCCSGHGGVARRRELERELDNLVRRAGVRWGAETGTASAAYCAASKVLAGRGPLGTAVELGRSVLESIWAATSARVCCQRWEKRSHSRAARRGARPLGGRARHLSPDGQPARERESSSAFSATWIERRAG